MLRLVLVLVALLSSAGATATLLSPHAHAPADEPRPARPAVREWNLTPTMTCMAPPTAPPPRDERMTVSGTLDPRSPSFEARFPVLDVLHLDHVLVDFSLDGGLRAGALHAELVDGQGRILKTNEGTSLAIDRAPAAGTFTARLTSDAPVSEAVRALVVVRYAAMPADGDRSVWSWQLRTSAPGASARGALGVDGATPTDLKAGWVDAPPLADDRVSVLDAYGNPTRAQEWYATLPSGGSGEFPLALGDEALELRDMGFSPPHGVQVVEIAQPAPPMPYACGPPSPVALDG